MRGSVSWDGCAWGHPLLLQSTPKDEPHQSEGGLRAAFAQGRVQRGCSVPETSVAGDEGGVCAASSGLWSRMGCGGQQEDTPPVPLPHAGGDDTEVLAGMPWGVRTHNPGMFPGDFRHLLS